MDNPALVINRTSRAILNSLGHIINIYIIAKYFSGITVLRGDRGSGKSNEGCVWQSLMDDQRITDNCSCFLFALFVFRDDNPFIKAILAAMGLICHNHYVSAFGQRAFAALKLKHRCKDDAVGLPTVKQGF